MNSTLVRNLCVIHHSWWNNPLMVFGLREYCPIYRFKASAVKAMRLILTREFSFQFILLSLLHDDVDHGVEVGILEDESLENIFSTSVIQESESKFCPLEGAFLFFSWTLSSGVLTQDCCCLRCCFSRRPRFTPVVKATDSRCTLEDSSSLQRCSNLVSHTRDIPR